MDKKCPNCGSNIPEEASFCLECFSPLKTTPLEFEEEKSSNSKTIPLIIIITTLIVAITFILVKFNNQKTDLLRTSTTTADKLTQVITTKQTTVTSSKTTTTTTETTSAKATATEKETTKKSKKESTSSTTNKKTTSTAKSTTTKKTTANTEIIFVGNTLQDYPKERKNTSYTIPYKVTKISDNAFNNNKYLKTLKFSKREKLDCDFQNLFANLPNLETVYVYPGTDVDLIGLQYFDGEIIYYD